MKANQYSWRYGLTAITLVTLVLGVEFAKANPESGPQSSSTTKVGNGDDGADLEKTEKITTGILQTTREKAIQHLKDLGSRSVPYLGSLIDEAERSDLYLVEENIKNPKGFDRGQEISPDGKFVYARTFARPYAATRFFPAALMLSEQQLVNLHIHEALHRALPESVRENESVVSEITLALVDPKASYDSVKAVTVAAVEKEQDRIATTGSQPMTRGIYNGAPQAVVYRDRDPEATERLKRPSLVRYSYFGYDRRAKDDDASIPILGMHRFDSYLHPFGDGPKAIGMGLSFSFINLPDRSYLGPLQISARYLMATWRQFDVEVYAEHSMYTLSAEELKNLPQARDVTTVGISMRREGDWFYSENYLAYTLPSESEFTVANSKYQQKYGALTNASVSVGAKYKAISLGVKGDLLLSQGYEVKGETFSAPADRVRMVKLGPELAVNYEALQWKAFAYQVIDGTPGAKLDDVADLMGHGAGQGYAGTSLAIQF